MTDRIIFLTLARTPAEKEGARLLVESLRQFGGEMSQCPVWLFESDKARGSCEDLIPLGVEIVPLEVNHATKRYVFSEKVSACHQAEKMASPSTKSFIWMDANCLVVHPPRLFSLWENRKARYALRI